MARTYGRFAGSFRTASAVVITGRVSRRAWWGMLAAAVLGLPLASCRDPQPDDPLRELVSLRPYTFRTERENDSCIWVFNYEGAGERVVGRGDSLRFLFPEGGHYAFGCKTYKGRTATLDILEYNVVENEQPMTPGLHRVLEYSPAPGQFVNIIPPYEAGDDAQSMALKAEKRLRGQVEGQNLITLGAYGGYVVFAFDHAVVNRPGEYDFKVHGNALANGAEPGCVRVGVDWNDNGKPDPWEWYELAGSMYHRPETIKGYSLTYSLDTTQMSTAVNLDLTDSTYIPWDDNQGLRGWVSKNKYHSQSYWPKWVNERSMTFQGVRLPNNFSLTNTSATNPQYRLRAFPWGYVDNTPDAYTPGFKIEWAVDRAGQPVELPAIDFVMVYTGVNQYCGWIGESSTEVSGAVDLGLQAK